MTEEQSIRLLAHALYILTELLLPHTRILYIRMAFAHALYKYKAPRVLHFSAFHCLSVFVHDSFSNRLASAVCTARLSRSHEP